MRKHVYLFTLITIMVFAVPFVWGIDINQGVVFLSEIGGGNITFGFDFVADSITWNSDQVRFSNFNESELWANLGFRAPSTGHLNVTVVNNTNIVIIPEIHAVSVDYELYVGGKGSPTAVSNVDAWSFVVDTVYFDTSANTTIIFTWFGPHYNISLGSIYSETEAGFFTMLYGNATRAGVNDGANVTFTIEGCSFTWNPTSGQYEGTILKATPQTVTFDVVDSFSSSEYVGETAIVNQSVTVTWTTGTLDLMLESLGSGDWVTGIMSTLLADLTLVGGWTLIMTIFSIGVYNYSGPYAVFGVWILGWGMFSTQVHGIALSLGLIMLTLGLGLALAKLFLDRRAS